MTKTEEDIEHAFRAGFAAGLTRGESKAVGFQRGQSFRGPPNVNEAWIMYDHERHVERFR